MKSRCSPSEVEPYLCLQSVSAKDNFRVFRYLCGSSHKETVEACAEKCLMSRENTQIALQELHLRLGVIACNEVLKTYTSTGTGTQGPQGRTLLHVKGMDIIIYMR